MPPVVRPQLHVARALLECQPASQHAEHTAAAGGLDGPMPPGLYCRQRPSRSPYRQDGRCKAVVQVAAANVGQLEFQTVDGGYLRQSSAWASRHNDWRCHKRNRSPARGLIDRLALRLQPALHSRQFQAVEALTQTYLDQQKPSHIRSEAMIAPALSRCAW